MTKCPVTECPCDEISVWQNVWCDEMTMWKNVLWRNVAVTKCLSDKISVTKCPVTKFPVTKCPGIRISWCLLSLFNFRFTNICTFLFWSKNHFEMLSLYSCIAESSIKGYLSLKVSSRLSPYSFCRVFLILSWYWPFLITMHIFWPLPTEKQEWIIRSV